MEITYTNTPDDVVAFHRYQLRHSPAWRRVMLIGVGSGLLAAAVMFIVLGGWQSWINTVFPVLFLIIYLVLYPILVRRDVGRTGLRLLQDGKNKGVWGPHTLTIDESGLNERTEFGESRVKWQGVEKIVASPTHLYIYISSNSAHVIPLRAFADSQQAERFIQQARTYFERVN